MTNDKFSLLVRLLEEMQRTGVPVIYKGAVVIQHIVRHSGRSDLARATEDIDMEWVDGTPSVSAMRDRIDIAVKRVNPNWEASVTREPGERRSAGIAIRDGVGAEVASMDIKYGVVQHSFEYRSAVNGVRFYGVTPEYIMADKLSVVSSRTVFRRIKDFYDIYAISSVWNFKRSEVLGAMSERGREIGDFDALINRVGDLEHAYGKMRGIVNKRDFQTVYEAVVRFLRPFAINTNTDMIWNGQEWERC